MYGRDLIATKCRRNCNNNKIGYCILDKCKIEDKLSNEFNKWFYLDLSDLRDFLINEDYVVQHLVFGQWVTEESNSRKKRIEIVTAVLLCSSVYRYRSRKWTTN